MLMSGAAFAADPVVTEENDWSGFYVGLHVGYGTSEFTNFDSEGDSCWYCDVDYGADVQGMFVGATAGYNIVISQVLLGIEGELGESLMTGSDRDPIWIDPRTNVDLGVYGTLAGRLGYSFGNFLLYGKAGWSFVSADIDWDDEYYASVASNDEVLSGAVFGGGIEYAVSSNISLKLEYMRFDVGDRNQMDVKGYCCDYEQDVEIEDIDSLKFGINVHF
jgi:opacity protein-like surface antigen